MFVRCPRCGGGAIVDPDDKTQLCPVCQKGQPETSVTDKSQARMERVNENPARPDSSAALSPLDEAGSEPMIRRTAFGENLAVLALVLPIAAQGVGLACQFESEIQLAVSVGAVALTALLLAVDAAFLGRVDLDGVERASPLAIFFGVSLLWIICYPVVFFRRRHFGRPNLGPVALLVALFFTAAPYLSDYLRFGVVSGAPLCTSKEVKSMVADIIRTSPIGPTVQSIDQFQETNFDKLTLTRKGECKVRIPGGSVTAEFTVKVVNAKTGAFQVDVAPIDLPPLCTDIGVTSVVDDMIRAGPNGHALKKVFGHVELRLDLAAKVRHGRCQATFDNRTVAVEYRVFWDANTRQYLVAVDP
jgi:hypothetical protein